MKKAILFIAGFSKFREEPDFDTLVHSLTYNQEMYKVQDNGRAALAGLTGKSLEATRINDSKKTTFDVFEADWEKYKIFLSKSNSGGKLLKGLGVIYFWLFSGAWKEVLKSKWLTLMALLTSAVFIFWYYGVFSIFVASLPMQWDILGLTVTKEQVKEVKEWLTLIEAWQLYIFMAAVLSFFPLNMFIDTLHFAKEYLQREELRHKLRTATSDALWAILGDKSYGSVTIVAHSLGVALALDLLGGFKKKGRKVRLVTLGGQIGVMQAGVDWLRKEVTNCARNDFIAEWRDYSSSYDYFSTNTPVKNPVMDFSPQNVSGRESLLRMIYGDSHYMYFERATVIQEIME